jgi:hypothetical protein
MASGRALRDANKEALWRRHVRGQASGGLSVRAYCVAHGLQEYSFYWWRRDLARREADPSAAFVPVTVAAETPVSDLSSMVLADAYTDLRPRARNYSTIRPRCWPDAYT